MIARYLRRLLARARGLRDPFGELATERPRCADCRGELAPGDVVELVAYFDPFALDFVHAPLVGGRCARRQGAPLRGR